MDLVAVDEGAPFGLRKRIFSQERIRRAKGHAGCSEFNPLLMFSASETRRSKVLEAARDRRTHPTVA
jgi:hypothetical protein